MQLLAPLFLLLALANTPNVDGKGVLVERRSAIRGSVNASALEEELDAALGEVLGCGADVAGDRLATIEQQLLPLWKTLPKNARGNIERRSLRYLVHRHFSRQSALQIRGFELTRPTNASGWGSEDILSQRVPAFVETFLESSHKMDQGFRLDDAARLVLTIEQLMFDFEGSLLDIVLADQRKPVDRSLSKQGLHQLLEGYLIRWMLGDDEEGIQALTQSRQLLDATIPHWDEIVAFADGKIEALAYQRKVAPVEAASKGASRANHNALQGQYSMQDAHKIVGDITHSFAHFWDSECRSMKASLVEMDSHHTGRVPLSKFYGQGLEAEWRFGESEDYLRELGALDESGWSKQVIIPNYIQASSNCIIGSQHYLVCCVNDCDAIMEEVEEHVGAPTANPELLLEIVSNVTSVSGSFDSTNAELPNSLKTQLMEIADSYGGEVPLHGRLFSQWLHYAFPRECPFPYVSGTVASLTPQEFGERYIASDEDMKKHATATSNATAEAEWLDKEKSQWMSQWSHEEELLATYSTLQLRAPWAKSLSSSSLAAVAAVVALVGLLASRRGRFGGRKGGDDGMYLPLSGKSHRF
mmetsp:Transcript_72942/g.152274  ORF Transcript_72942/g.152274 Transcript_72942/m.152274 type:complete len:585 (-) Transcript_72942:187-1941(-)|eukprot:CAMPEP_0206487760 /NCGR_PEP_ID=MMETSP0324_2-20121206/41887_1 /ASSEMBLY_ACC=CAM_ASM_000836 /TAXON_ID=2866 /ORGANISM="Crypthecodinium cohnii, Strain Seligo" /LENGTH=584 /DNA_ID=CAMNT_0053966411 /DNA_START=285 /DNA_END=2039 /DNA_ORIENTATION=-